MLIIVILLFVSQCGGPDDSADTAGGTSSAESAATTTKTSAETSPATSTSASATTTEQEEEAVAEGQCPDSSIGITVSAERPNYTVGEQPRFFTTITNIGNVPCERDFGDAITPNVVTTLDGQTQLWSSTDCFPGGEPRVVTLEPGKQETTKINWSATTSNEGCEPDQRVPVGPGAYVVTAFNGDKASEPATFNIG